jgi:DNA-binding NarL/FixJ family response regulator
VTLTRRQLQVLDRLTAGRTNHQIALDLGVTDKTIERHLSDVYAAFGVQSRIEAALYAIEHGYCLFAARERAP